MADDPSFEHDSNPVTDRRLAALEDQVRALRQGQSDQTAIIAEAVQKVDVMGANLAQNNAQTADVYAIAQSFRGAGKVLQWLGGAIKWTATVAAALAALWAIFTSGGQKS